MHNRSFLYHEYASQQVELAVALAAIRTLETTLASTAGQSYDLSAVIDTYRAGANSEGVKWKREELYDV